MIKPRWTPCTTVLFSNPLSFSNSYELEFSKNTQILQKLFHFLLHYKDNQRQKQTRRLLSQIYRAERFLRSGMCLQKVTASGEKLKHHHPQSEELVLSSLHWLNSESQYPAKPRGKTLHPSNFPVMQGVDKYTGFCPLEFISKLPSTALLSLYETSLGQVPHHPMLTTVPGQLRAGSLKDHQVGVYNWTPKCPLQTLFLPCHSLISPSHLS